VNSLGWKVGICLLGAALVLPYAGTAQGRSRRKPVRRRPAAAKPAPPTAEPNRYVRPEMLVEPAWLAGRVSAKDVRIVDLRDAEPFIQGHLPNAVHFAPDFLRYGEDKETYLPPLDTLQQRLRAMGISSTTHVVVYDDDAGRMPSRFWLVLLNHGFSRVSLLNGGMKRWIAEGRDVSTDVVRFERGDLTLKGRGPIVCAHKDVKPAKDVLLLDARSPDEYKQGHIPGAVQIDWRDNVKPDGTFKSARELRTLYQGRGITRDREITTYCNNGARAAHAAFALTLLGYPRIRVYYGSMLDYGQRQAPQER